MEKPRRRVAVAGVLAACTAVCAPAAAAPAAAGDDAASLRARIAEVRADVDELHAAGADAVDRYYAEADRLDAAEDALAAAERAADRASAAGGEARRGAAGQAVAAYTGADTGPLTAWLSPRGPQEALDRSSYLSLLAEHRGADLDRAEAEAVAAEAAADTAADAVDRQRIAADDADQARTEAQQALDGRRGALAGLLERQTELEAELAALEPAGPAPAPAPALARQASSGDGCDPGSVSEHPNGKIPEEELCPLDQPGEMLRADAAAAFRELDSAFSAEFGRGLCVTDSYRPLDEQEQLFRDMEAGMAADPGTSTHGLGTAVDLCGGVESTGTGEHEWMLANAPDHGWHNPEWARGGFEPWHWEYQP